MMSLYLKPIVFGLQHLSEKTVKRRNQYQEEQDQAVFIRT